MSDLIDEKLNNMHTDIVEIKEQTTKTNGRVTKLENWRNYITGGLAVLTLLVIPVLLLVVAKLLG